MTTTPALTPLSHHEAIRLAEPLLRRGRQVDLAASDRPARVLSFRPVDHPAGRPGRPALREVLTLKSFGTGTCRLTRSLHTADGASATLQAQGSDLAELLARIEAVDPWHHFRQGPGWVLARDYWLDGGAAVLTRGVLQLHGLELVMTVSLVRGVSAELQLRPTGAVPLQLPEDLLAVLGWDWARLIAERGGWRSRLRLRGRALRRSARAEAALDRAALHLARTLAEPPAQFHARHLGARWGVVLRRAIPVLTPLALLATVLGMPKLDTSGGPGLWWLLYHVPTVLIAVSFCLQELPRFEIPPLPRRRNAGVWPADTLPGPRDTGDTGDTGDTVEAATGAWRAGWAPPGAGGGQ